MTRKYTPIPLFTVNINKAHVAEVIRVRRATNFGDKITSISSEKPSSPPQIGA